MKKSKRSERWRNPRGRRDKEIWDISEIKRDSRHCWFEIEKSKILQIFKFVSYFQTLESQMSVRLSICLSVCHRNPSASQNCSYCPSSLSTIEPINLWSSFATFKPFSLFSFELDLPLQVTKAKVLFKVSGQLSLQKKGIMHNAWWIINDYAGTAFLFTFLSE